MSLRSEVVRIARSYLGEGPQPEWHGVQWCGLFALGVLHEAGLARDISWRVGGGVVLEHPEAFPMTISPHPGDIGIKEHNSAGKDVWHYVIVTERSGNLVKTIAGNTGQSPGIVGESHADVTDPNWKWYSIEPVEAVP